MARGPRPVKVPRHVKRLHADEAREQRIAETAAPVQDRSKRKVWPYVAGGTAAAGAGALVVARRRKKETMTKSDTLVLATVAKSAPDELVLATVSKAGPVRVGRALLTGGLSEARPPKKVPSVREFGVRRSARAVATGGLSEARRSVGKANTFATRDQNSGGLRSVTARTPEGRFVSHENDLKVVHITPKRNPTSKLAVYGRSHGRKLR